jgi:hypothetical protein
MADPKDNESFFRKVVRFVANPATDWHELNSRQDGEIRETELEKSELKAMIERKRRNDFVRKREFDMLRRVRREGLTPEQLSALGTSSRIDDSEVRNPDSVSARAGGGVKAKIDEIEQQMVGESQFQTSAQAPVSRAGSFFGPSGGRPAPTGPGALSRPEAPPPRRSPAPPAGVDLPILSSEPEDRLPALPPLPDLDDDAPPSRGPARGGPTTATPAIMATGLSPLAPLTLPPSPPAGSSGAMGTDVEVSEVVHDPELDEAVIAFANADFEQCEQALTRLTSPTGQRAQHAETWLVLFDLFRAIGQQQRFESLAMEYAHQFGWSAPQWYSLPQLVADAAIDDGPRPDGSRAVGDVGWVAPETLDHDALARLRSLTLQMPLPWIFDWSALKRIDAEAATQLSVLCRLWGAQALEMRWIGGDRLFAVLQESAPTGVRDADPAFWLARLDALRLANRADQFDETAIDYCVTYEVSPPSWEPARCTVHIGGHLGGSPSTRTPPMSVVGEVSTSFFESGLADDMGVELASVELSGQLIGDINEILRRLNDQIGAAPMVSVSCSRLIRVDFLAAGDLLNWVLTRRGENRTVQFTDAHRLVALFFTAMGISEHATVQIRKV